MVATQISEPWDQMLAEGAWLVRGRIKLIKEIQSLTQAHHYELSQGKEVLRLDNQPSFDPAVEEDGQLGLPVDLSAQRSAFSHEEIRDGFQVALTKRHRKDIQRGSTSIGPHRDEMRFSSTRSIWEITVPAVRRAQLCSR